MAASLISVYEAALLWFGRNPHERLDGYGGVYDWIILLTRDREVRDIACDILFEIESGRMQAVNPSWRDGNTIIMDGKIGYDGATSTRVTRW